VLAAIGWRCGFHSSLAEEGGGGGVGSQLQPQTYFVMKRADRHSFKQNGRPEAVTYAGLV
jgi:hypothetical protein